MELINKYDLGKWKECVGLIYSMSSRDKRPSLLKQLAQRLIDEGEMGQENDNATIAETYAPIICFILAEDFVRVADLYAQNLRHFKSGSLKRKKVVVEYARRLVSINEGMTTESGHSKSYNQILR